MANLSYEDQTFLLQSLEKIINSYDILLIDSSAGIGESVLWFNQWAHVSLVILTAEPTSMTDAYALIKVMSAKYDKKDFYLLMRLWASTSL